MAKRVVAMFALAVVVLFAPAAFAQEFTHGVRATGMGMAYTGVGSGTSGLYFNPGGIASKMMYQIEGAYELNPAGSVLSASIVDSKTNPDVAAGLAYSYFFGRGDSDGVTGHDIRLSLAIPVLPERISVGVGGRYMIVKTKDPDTGKSLELINGFTLDAGALFRISDSVQLGVAGRNLLDLCSKDQQCSTVAPTTIMGGASFGNPSQFLLSADGGVDLTSDPNGAHPIFSVGAEYFAGAMVPIRLGYQRLAATGQNMLTAGLGVRMKTAGLDAGFRMDLNNPDQYFANGSVSLFF